MAEKIGFLDHSDLLTLEDLPADPGSYALRLLLRDPVCLRIGRLGQFSFPAGDYLYLGSAHGPGGLRARLRHHTRVMEHPHWHLDWLRPHGVLAGGWFSTAPGVIECDWSQALLQLPGAALPAPGFGSSDCRAGCAAHLVAFPCGMDERLMEARLDHLHPLIPFHSLK